MAFDFKKEYKEFYAPPKKPTIVEVPPMSYIAVRGPSRLHHEIYLSDPRRCAPERLKTVLRHPIKRA